MLPEALALVFPLPPLVRLQVCNLHILLRHAMLGLFTGWLPISQTGTCRGAPRGLRGSSPAWGTNAHKLTGSRFPEDCARRAMYRRLASFRCTDEAPLDAQLLACWLSIYPSARKLHPARRWWQPRAGMRFWRCWALLGVAGHVRRDVFTRELPNGGGFPPAKPDLLYRSGLAVAPAEAADWLVGLDPRRILQSRTRTRPPTASPVAKTLSVRRPTGEPWLTQDCPCLPIGPPSTCWS